MLKQAKNVFIVGIKGVAMANIAIILKKMGKHVSGVDDGQEYITDPLLAQHLIKISDDFNNLNLLKKIDLVIYSASHLGDNNPLVREAKKRKINTVHQAQVLGELLSLFNQKIAICGCHGKTTTTSLITHALINLNQQPSYLVGVPFIGKYQGGDYQQKKYFIIEADEYGVNPPIDKTPKFHYLNPDYIIVNNIDFDHPDVFQDINHTRLEFKRFFKKIINHQGKIVTGLDNDHLYQVVKTLPKGSVVTFGFTPKADYQIDNVIIKSNLTQFSLVCKKVSETYQIKLFGEKNIINAAGCIVFLRLMGFKPDAINQAIKNFTGPKRRSEIIYQQSDMVLIDDYAHHPSEIEATIDGLRQRYPQKEIIVIFQPHTFTRTKMLLKQFGQSLSLANQCLLLPIFPSAREKKGLIKVTSNDIVKQSRKTNIQTFKNSNDLISYLKRIIKPNQVIVTMGAGDVYKLSKQIIDVIKQKNENKNNLNIIKNKDLFPYLTLRTKSQAQYFFEARTRDDLITGVKYAQTRSMPFFIIGGGSNIALVSSKINGLIIKNNYIDKKILKSSDQYVDIQVSSGYPMAKLVNETIEVGLEGLEYHKGLPGTVGGAVVMNSKWTKPLRYISDYLVSCTLIDNQGNIKTVLKKDLKFSHGFSVLQKTQEVLVDITFRFKKFNKQILFQRADESLKYRLTTQPKGVPTCGCFFRNISDKIKTQYNIPSNSVGFLIDKAGLKGKRVGSFYISDVHANFILNDGQGDSRDLVKLIKIIKKAVKTKWGLDLQEEVIIK